MTGRKPIPGEYWGVDPWCFWISSEGKYALFVSGSQAFTDLSPRHRINYPTNLSWMPPEFFV